MGDIARWAALAAGFPDSVPAATVNRFCASSLTCAIQIAHAIRSDELGVGLAGGVESMSRSGWAFMKGEAPFMPRGPIFMLDTMWAGAGGPPNPEPARPGRVHRHDADRAERRRSLRAVPRGDRRVRAALPPARGRRTRLGTAGAGDPSGRDPGHAQRARAHVRARREHPRRHDRGEARGAAGAARTRRR